jgi:hypothetical protein
MTRRTARNIALGIAAVPVAQATIASLLYFAAGGVGGGHGHYDLEIGLLGLPTTWFGELVIPHVALPDLFLIIWYPALLNLCLVWGPIAFVVFHLLRRNATLA